MPRRPLTVEALRKLLADAFNGRAPTAEQMRFARILNGLPIRGGEEWRIVPDVTALIAMADAIPKTPLDLKSVRPIGLAKWERQRRTIITAAKTMKVANARAALAEMREPMVLALAREGFIRPAKLSKAMLPRLRAAAENAEPLGVPEEQHREQSAKDRMVARVADVLAGIYCGLTGQAPDHLGKFYWLVVDVFAAMDIDRNPRVAAQAAAARWMARLSLVRRRLVRLLGLRGAHLRGDGTQS